MARPHSLLVVASVTADSPQLVEALRERARQRGPMRTTLLLPCTGPGLHSREQAQQRLDEALEVWREQGLTDVHGVVGDQQPIVAVLEAWDPLLFDEIVVSTLPGHASDWLRWDVPHRIARATDAQVTHIVSSPPANLTTEPVPKAEPSPLGPLSVLGWGHPKNETTEERQRRLRALGRR
jgi:hypothetical protein